MFVDEIQRLPNLLNLPQELGESFELERVLRWGSIPLIWESADREQSLKAYVQLYSKEEIKAEALVRILPGFARYKITIDGGCFYSYGAGGGDAAAPRFYLTTG